MKAKLLLLSLAVVAMVSSCSSSRNAPQYADPDAVEILIPCAGLDYVTSIDYFRANGSGISNSPEVAGQKALSSARSKLAAEIETVVKTVTDNYVSSYEVDQIEEFRGRFQTVTREVVMQKLNGIRVICQKTLRGSNGQYTAYVAIELAGAEIVNPITNKLTEDEKLRTDFEYNKFLEVFNSEMSKTSSY